LLISPNRGSLRPQQPRFVFLSRHDWIIAGAGFTGAVLAERIASQLEKKVLVVDRRGHIAGNAYDLEGERGVLIHKYGPHIFHTNAEKVWRYLSAFTGWRPYEHRVLGEIDGKLVPIPFNLDSLEALFPAREAAKLSALLIETYGEGKNVPILKMRESGGALKELADFIYAKVFENYTLKQWSLRPEELDPSVSARVPVRISRDGRYFQDSFQSMPADGYTAMFARILNHPNIEVATSTDFRALPERGANVIFTGPIDEYFDYQFGALPYRSLRFHFTARDVRQAQPVGTVNYPNDHAYTRITEFKHLTGQECDGTVLVEEYPQAHEPGKTEPYYPIPTPGNARKLQPYLDAARALEGKVWFAGRLGDYAYYNMDQACARALALFEKQIAPFVRGDA
jgi:UDP-galactopyranose mutase